MESSDREALDIQRGKERGLRATKRELVALDEAIKATKDDALKKELSDDFGRISVKLSKQESSLNDFLDQTGFKKDYSCSQIKEFNRSMSGKIKAASKKELQKQDKSAIMNTKQVSTGGLRNEKPLTERQIKENMEYAILLGMPKEQIRYGEHYNTAYGSEFDMLYIGTDVYPSTKNNQGANSRISNKGAIAHEIIGHRETALNGMVQADDVLDEIQASIRAARFAPELTKSERFTLLRDAAERAKKNKIRLRDVKDKLYIKKR